MDKHTMLIVSVIEMIDKRGDKNKHVCTIRTVDDVVAILE